MTDLLFLPISGPRGASSRYRVFQFLSRVEEAGFDHILHAPPERIESGWQRMLAAHVERRQIVHLTRKCRALFIQKRLFPASLIDTLANTHPFLFDFDDAIFTSPTGGRSAWSRRRVESRLRHTLQNARIVVAGNAFLADYARQYAHHVVTLPTVLDHRLYPAKKHASSSEVVIGWIGHSVNHPYLHDLANALREVARHMTMRLLVVSDCDIEIPGIRIENRRWSAETEVADLLAMDIGIMPLPDDVWSRGKCGFKAIQYMATGIPVVCSDVGANPDIVRHGIDGYCVRSPRDWSEALVALCDDVEQRQRLGAAGRQRVADAFSLESATPAFLQIMEALCGR